MELWDEETETDVHSIGIFTLPEMEFPFATMDEVMQEIRRVAAEIVSAAASFRSCWAASTRLRRRSSPPWRRNTRACRCCRSTRTPTCASRSWARRTTTRARCAGCSSTRAHDAGRHPQPVAGRGRRRPDAADRRFSTTSTCGRTTDWIEPRRRLARRDGVHHDRLRRLRSGDHAGGGHARTGRADVVRERSPCSAASSSHAAWSAATSSSSVRCPATSRRTSSARS